MGLTSSKPPPDNGVYILIILALLVIIINLKEKIEKKEKRIKIKKNELDAVIGLESVKNEIRYYMDFIKNKEKYKDWFDYS